ncbi:hypothetical protein [Eikenella corrodens]|nr:hypothetical protein [Eikenella corrodens]
MMFLILLFFMLFFMGFIYGYFRKRRGQESFGFIGWFFLLASVFVAFLLSSDYPQDVPFIFLAAYIFGRVFLPVTLFIIGYFSGRKMELF